MRKGLVELINRGLRFFVSDASSTYVGLRSPSVNPSNSFDIRLPNSLPGVTSALTIDNTGQIGVTAIGGGGTVTSVGLSAPSIFSVTGSPITTSGTLTVAFVSQSQGLFLASPTGATGAPAMRAIASSDIPKTLDNTWITNFDAQVRSSRLDQMAVPTAALNFNSQRITGLADPTNNQDAVTKAYADSLISTGNNKGTVRVASTGNVNLATPGSAIDGVTLANGDLVLLKDQSTASQNGLYVFNGAAVPMTRSTNADTNAEVRAGLFVFVSEGTANGNNGYTLTTDDPITVGTTALAFTQTSGAGQITAGSGMTKTGNQLDVVGTANRIVVNADSIDIAANYVGQSSITTVGTIGTGIWNGTAIAISRGGTGATDAATARSNLGAAGIFRQSFTTANLTAGLLSVVHNLGQKIVSVQISDNNDRVIIPDEITLTSTTQSTIDLTSFAGFTGTWNLVVVG